MIVSDLPPAATPAAVEVAHHCPARGSRHCFPRDMTGHRGSGRITAWYRVQVGGYETLYTAAGEAMAPEFVLDGFNLELPDPGFFGHGIKAAIETAAAEEFPHRQLIDFWPLSAPPATES